MHLNHPPIDVKVDAEVAKEYQWQEEEKRKAPLHHNKDMESMRTSVTNLGGTITQLGETMIAS